VSTPLDVSFPDLNGVQVSLKDARFRGKVLLVSISGSWCPNCHDEAPFLTELYRTYHDRGLEIVLLAFEEAGQLPNPVRLKAFVKQYGITYPVLIAGEPKELAAKLPQFEDLVAFPTSIYVGRDGRVRGTHAGFSSKATGPLYTETTAEITHTVEGLLAEKAGLTSLAPRSSEQAELTSSAPQQRISVHAYAKRRSPKSYDLTLTVQPHERMHVYAPGADGYTAVSLTFASAPGVKVTPATYPKTEDYYFVPTKEHLPVYQRSFDIVVRATVPAELTTLEGMLTYQACDDRLCYTPQTLSVVFTLPPDR
jgi:thiol-disulfide isomerase/thioredoxin